MSKKVATKLFSNMIFKVKPFFLFLLSHRILLVLIVYSGEVNVRKESRVANESFSQKIIREYFDLLTNRIARDLLNTCILSSSSFIQNRSKSVMVSVMIVIYNFHAHRTVLTV